MYLFVYLYVPLWRTRPLFKAYVEFKKGKGSFSGREGVVFFCFVWFSVKKYIIIEIVFVAVAVVVVVVILIRVFE